MPPTSALTTTTDQCAPAADLHQRLGRAIAVLGAPCEGDPRFTLDEPDLDVLRPLCAACPVSVLCGKYAQAARPIGGVWAGQRYGHEAPRSLPPRVTRSAHLISDQMLRGPRSAPGQRSEPDDAESLTRNLTTGPNLARNLTQSRP